MYQHFTVKHQHGYTFDVMRTTHGDSVMLGTFTFESTATSAHKFDRAPACTDGEHDSMWMLVESAQDRVEDHMRDLDFTFEVDI